LRQNQCREKLKMLKYPRCLYPFAAATGGCVRLLPSENKILLCALETSILTRVAIQNCCVRRKPSSWRIVGDRNRNFSPPPPPLTNEGCCGVWCASRLMLPPTPHPPPPPQSGMPPPASPSPRPRPPRPPPHTRATRACVYIYSVFF
jgi:hypothetical protein